MATQDISQLVVEVKSQGIQTAANQLDKLARASEKAEAAVKKLGTVVVTTQGATATAQAQSDASSVNSATTTAQKMIAIMQRRDLELYRIRSATENQLRSLQQKRDTEEWQAANAQASVLAGIQQKRDMELYEARIAEAARIKAIQEKRDVEEYTAAQEQAARIKAIQQKRDIEIYTERVEAAAKLKAIQERRDMEEYTSAQSEAARIKAIEQKRDIELYEMRVASNAKLAAADERQRQMNAAFQTASIGSQIRTAREAQAYAALGGDATARFGSAAATADIAALTAEQKRLAAATLAARNAQNAENAALAEAHALARGLSGSFGALWVTYGNMLGMGVGIAIGASLKGVVEVGKDVENTLESIRVLGGATTKEVDEMSAAITSLGQGVQGPKDVAEAFHVLTMAGLNAKEAMQGVQAALNLAVAGGVSVEKASETLVQVGTALGYTAEGFDHVGDVIAKTAAASMSSVDSISNAFKSAAAVGEVYGASLNDIAIGLAAVANLGIQGTSAGTALKNMYKDLSASTQKVTGTLKDMHLQVTDFRDADGFMLPLADVIKKLNDGLGTLSGKARNMAMVKLFSQQGVREAAELLKLVNTASKEIDPQASEKAGKAVMYANKLVELQAQIQQADAFATQAAIAMAQTTTNQMKSVGHTLQTTFIEVFKSIEPQINEVARAMRTAFASPEFKSGLTSVITAIADLTKFTIEHAKAVGAVVAAWAGWKLVETATGLVKIAQAFDIASISAKAFLISLGPLAVAIAALGAAWLIYKANMDTALDKNAATNNLQDYINNTVKAAAREAEILEMRKKGASEADILRKQQMDADKDASDAAVKSAEKELKAKRDYVAELKKSMNPIELSMANEALQKGIKETQFGSINKYLDATRALTSAEQAYANQVHIVRVAEKSLAELRGQNAAAQTEAARQALKNRPTGDGELSGKVDTKAINDAYNAYIKAQQDIMKAASQELQQFRETEQARFKEGQIGQLQVINDTADAEIAAYRKTADAARAAKAKADATPNRTADAERFRAEAERADADAAQASKMRDANALAAARAMEAQLISLKVKSLDEQGKFVEAADLKWSSEGKLQLQQAQADLAAYGSKYPWLSELVKQYAANRDAALNSAQLKQDATAFDTAMLRLEGTLKGFKAETYGTSIDAVFESATKATEKFNKAMIDAGKKRDELGFDALTGGPEAMKKYEEANKQLAAMTDKQKTMWQEVGQTITDSLTTAFGTSGTALGNLYKATIQYQQTENASTSDRIKQYGDMAQAASGFFDKQSKGYRVLNGISEVFHMAEMARTVVRTAAYIAEGAANMFGQGGFAGFAGVAAMGAVMAGLGWALSGASSHGADPKMDAEFVQKHQGTGTVFGDADAKSEAITKALDDLKSNSDLMLPLTQGMLNSLQNIEAAMGGLANLAIRQGVTNGSNFNVQSGTLSRTGDNWNKTLMGTNSAGGALAYAGIGAMLGGPIGALAGSIIGAIAGPLLGKVVSLWGKTTQDITDSGLQFGGKVSDLVSGQGFNQYANVKTTSSSWFGLSKSSSNNVLTQGVSDQLSQQFGLVFSGLEDALKGAATSLGSSSDAVGKAIDNVVLQTTKVSLKDLKGQDLTDAINNVLSEAMDTIAQQAYPQMAQFEQVGEGYAQTVIRVASAVEQADSALKKLGVQAIDYTDIASKTGDVAFQIVQQSIALKEGASGVGQIMTQVAGSVNDLVSTYTDLVAARKQMQGMGLGSGLNYQTLQGAGDLKSLTSDLSNYYDKYFSATEQAAIQTKNLTEQFAAFGYDLPNSREQLRKWIETAASTGDQLKVGELLSLANGFDALESSLEKLGKTTDPFSDSAVSVAKAAYDDAMTAAENAYTVLENAVNAQKTTIQSAKDELQTQVDAINNVLTTLADALKATAPAAQTFSQGMGVIRNAISAVNGGGDITKIAGLDDAIKTVSSQSTDSYSTSLDYQRAQAQANAALTELQSVGQGQLSVAQKQIDLYQKQLDDLDKQLETAKAQLDALKGINDSVLSVAQALAAFGIAMTNATTASANYKAVQAGNTGNGVTDALESLYKNVLGRSSDAAGMAWWTNQIMNNGVSMSEVTKDFYNSDEYKANPTHSLPSFAVGTNDVPEDMIAKIHKGERIVPAADNAEIKQRLRDSGSDAKVDTSALEAKIDDLIEVMQTGDVANVQKTNELFKIVREWHLNGMPPEREDK